MNKYDHIIDDVKKVYAEMVAITVRGGCKEGFADLAAAVLTQTVMLIDQSEIVVDRIIEQNEPKIGWKKME